VAQTPLEQSVVINPGSFHHLEAVWFAPQRQEELLSRDSRLAGFDLERPRVSLSDVTIAPIVRRNAYLDVRDTIIRGHGALSEVVFETVATMYGVFAPDLLCFSAWPDEGSLESFLADRRAAALRDEAGVADVGTASGRLDRSFHASDEPFTMRYNAGFVYELCALWNREGCTPEQRQGFFDSVVPSLTRHRAGPGMGIVPTRGEYRPHLLCLSEWPSLENFAGFIADADHVEVSRKRFAAFTRMDATATRLYTGRAELELEDPARLAAPHGGQLENA
jgi:hypothetical protein